MSKLIQEKIYAVLKTFDVTLSLDFIEVTKPRNKSNGDYTTNILLKNKLIDHHIFINKLSLDSLFEKVEYKNGFVNIFLLSKKIANKEPYEEIDIKEKIRFSDKYLFQRIKNIHHRLEEEGYESDSNMFFNEFFIDLVKTYNYLFENVKYFNFVDSKDIEVLFKSFGRLDENTVYRKLDCFELAEIKNLLRSIILLVERISYE